MKLKFVSLIIFFLLICIFIIKSFLYPALQASLKYLVNGDLSITSVEFCGLDCLRLNGVYYHQTDFIDFSADVIELSPGHRSTGIFTSKWILKHFVMENADIILYNKLTDSLFKSSPDAKKGPVGLPFFPLDEVRITSMNIAVHIKDQYVNVTDFSFTGKGTYLISVPSLLYRNPSLKKQIVAGSLSLSFFAENYRYDPLSMKVQLPGFSMNGDMKVDAKKLKLLFTADSKVIASYFDIPVTGIVSGQVEYMVDRYDPYISVSASTSGVRYQDLDPWDIFIHAKINRYGVRVDKMVWFDAARKPVFALDGTMRFSEEKIKGRMYLFDFDFKNIFDRVKEVSLVRMLMSGTIDYTFDFATLVGTYDADLTIKDFNVMDREVLDFNTLYYAKLRGIISSKKATFDYAEVTTDDGITKAYMKDSYIDYNGPTFYLYIPPESIINLSRLRHIAGIRTGGWGYAECLIENTKGELEVHGRYQGKECDVQGIHGEECDVKVDYTGDTLLFTLQNFEEKSISTSGSSVAIDFSADEPVVRFEAKDIKGNAEDIASLFGESSGNIIEGKFELDGNGVYEKESLTKLNLFFSGHDITVKDAVRFDAVKLNLKNDDDNKVAFEDSFLKYKETIITVGGTIDKSDLNSDISLSLKSFNKDNFEGIEKLRFAQPELEVQLSGLLHTPDITASVEIADINLDGLDFGRFKAEAAYKGAKELFSFSGGLDAAFSFYGSLAHFDPDTLNGNVKIHQMHQSYQGIDLLLSMDAAAKDGMISAVISDIEINSPYLDLKNAGQVEIKGKWDDLTLLPAHFLSDMLDLTLSGNLKNGIPTLEFNGKFSPIIINAVAGTYLAQPRGMIELKGKWADKKLSADINLLNTGFQVIPLSMPVMINEGKISIDNNNWKIVSFNGSAGGGKLTLKGNGNFLPFTSTQLSMSITNANVAYSYVGRFSISSNIDVLFAKGNPPVITGNIDLKNLTYRGDFSTGGKSNAKYFESEILPFLGISSQKGVYITGRENTANAMSPQLNLRITGKNNIRISNSLVRSGLMFELNVAGTVASPQVTGSISMQDGEIIFNQNEFAIQRGIITLEPGGGINPYLDIEASDMILVQSKNTNYKLVLEVFGYLSDLKIQLTSVPRLEQNQVYSILLWGDFNDTDETSTQNMAIAALTTVLGISGEIKKNFNFTRFEITPEYSEYENKTVLKVYAEKEIYPSFFFAISANPQNAEDQSLFLKYQGTKFDLIVDWRYLNKLDSPYGAVGFEVLYNYVVE